MARPSKFSKELGEKILHYVLEGYTNEVSYAKAGVSPRTVYRWRNKADKQKTKTDLKCFFEELELVEKLRQGKYEDITRKEALENKNAAVAKWYLAHLDRDNFGNQDPPLSEDPEMELTDDDVEWINHGSDYNS